MKWKRRPSRTSSLSFSILPIARKAAARASSGDMPLATFSAISASRWKRNSSESLFSDRLPISRLADYEINAAREPLPLRHFGLELLPPGPRQRIKLRVAPQLRLAPFGLEPPLLL